MWVPSLIIVVLFIGTSVSISYDPERRKISEEFYNEHLTYRATHHISPRFQDLIDELSSPVRVRMGEEFQMPTVCDLCDAVAVALLKYYHSAETPEEFRDVILDICVTLKIHTLEVCSGIIDLNLGTVTYIIENTPSLTPEKICATVLQGSDCMEETNYDVDWTVNVILGDKPAISRTVHTQPNADSEVLTVIHLTDIHYDPSYKIGGNAVCEEPTCCRVEQASPNRTDEAAGYWGDYRSCDVPLHSLQAVLDEIVQQHPKIDYVYFTGDLVDHGVWETSQGYNKYIFSTVHTAFQNTFVDIPVFPALGNHESSPVNVYAPPEITDDEVSTQWVYEAVASHWSHWLPNETMSTILHGGFYTTLARPGLRIISLNNNVCYVYNWWLLYDSHDPGKQLQWLAETLLQAEKDGEKVHILAHIPPGDSECHYIWNSEFRKIIDRFEGTVIALFNGHTHNDAFRLFYSLNDSTRATNIAFDGGSVTTYSDLNSNYRVYKVDATTGAVLDYETWIYNLTEANQNGKQKPKWYKLYSFRKAYGVKSMTPAALDELVHRMAAHHELLEQYQRYFVKDGDPLLSTGCDTSCLTSRLCGIVQTDATDKTKCEELLEEFNANRFKK
ncbi:sphingomyelin phosphodiesterase-like isoform X1 [Anabrus simplex]|uniref:sphingomyelin phosphodiesterase-like isoform X1 n=2 Tax=Anabrus simplex TaxID=316456 RepID=UPI0035A363EA